MNFDRLRWADSFTAFQSIAFCFISNLTYAILEIENPLRTDINARATTAAFFLINDHRLIHLDLTFKLLLRSGQSFLLFFKKVVLLFRFPSLDTFCIKNVVTRRFNRCFNIV